MRIPTNIALALVVCFVVSTARAEVKQDKDLPKRGSLSTSKMTGSVVNNVPAIFGEENPYETGTSPITGSVSKVNNTTWIAKLFNNSKLETYSIDIEIVQRNDRGTVVKRDSFSMTLRPGATNSREVSAGVGVLEADLNLLRYKNISKNKAVPTPAAKP